MMDPFLWPTVFDWGWPLLFFFFLQGERRGDGRGPALISSTYMYLGKMHANIRCLCPASAS